jgi:hypothetical protein
MEKDFVPGGLVDLVDPASHNGLFGLPKDGGQA